MSEQSPLRGDPLWLRLTRLINDEIHRVVEERLQPFVTGRKLDLSRREGIVGFLPPSRGGSGNNVGLKDHDHSGMASGNARQLTQANTHQSADTDGAASSLHHTLGASATQAAPGNHGHALANLTDVALTSPASAQVLTYDGALAKWKNAAGGAGHTIQDHTTSLAQRGLLNFTGVGVSATDNASTSATDVTVPGVTASAPITVSGGAGAAQTVGINPATSAAAGSMSAADKSKLDGYPSSFGAGLRLALNWAATTDLQNGATFPANTWTNLAPAQSFTIQNANSLALLWCDGMALFKATTSVEVECGLRVSIDSTSYMVAGGYASPGYFANVLTGTSPLAVTGLAAGSHTVTVQLYPYSDAYVYCRAATQPNFESLRIVVLERLP